MPFGAVFAIIFFLFPHQPQPHKMEDRYPSFRKTFGGSELNLWETVDAVMLDLVPSGKYENGKALFEDEEILYDENRVKKEAKDKELEGLMENLDSLIEDLSDLNDISGIAPLQNEKRGNNNKTDKVKPVSPERKIHENSNNGSDKYQFLLKDNPFDSITQGLLLEKDVPLFSNTSPRGGNNTDEYYLLPQYPLHLPDFETVVGFSDTTQTHNNNNNNNNTKHKQVINNSQPETQKQVGWIPDRQTDKDKLIITNSKQRPATSHIISPNNGYLRTTPTTDNITPPLSVLPPSSSIRTYTESHTQYFPTSPSPSSVPNGKVSLSAARSKAATTLNLGASASAAPGGGGGNTGAGAIPCASTGTWGGGGPGASPGTGGDLFTPSPSSSPKTPGRTFPTSFSSPALSSYIDGGSLSSTSNTVPFVGKHRMSPRSSLPHSFPSNSSPPPNLFRTDLDNSPPPSPPLVNATPPLAHSPSMSLGSRLIFARNGVLERKFQRVVRNGFSIGPHQAQTVNSMRYDTKERQEKIKQLCDLLRRYAYIFILEIFLR